MDAFWEYFSVLAPSVGLGLIFWLVMRSLFRADSGERTARAELEEREAREWARLRHQERSGGAGPAPGGAGRAGAPGGPGADDGGAGRPGAGRPDMGGTGGTRDDGPVTGPAAAP